MKTKKKLENTQTVTESPEIISETNATDESKKGRKFPAVICLAVTLGVAVLIIGGVVLYHAIHYKNRWYKNTYINDVNVSGQTLADSKKLILKKLGNYGLTIQGRDQGTLTIDGDKIDYSLSISKEFDKLFEEEHESFSLLGKKNNFDVKYDVSYNEEKLEQLISDSSLVAGSADYSITRPKSAKVVYSEEKQQFECQKEVLGNKIIESALIDAVKDALQHAETVLNIDDTAEEKDSEVVTDIYKKPAITSDSEELQEHLALSNQVALRYIVWNMGQGVKEQITPAEISNWISIKDGEVKYNWKKVANWIEDFCLKYKTVGIDREVKMHNNKVVTVSGGDFGWQIDYEKTLKQAKKALKAEIDDDAIQAYIDDPSEDNKEALTLKRKVLYANKGFKKDYENFAEDWDTENFIEISLKEQKVYVIRDGKVKFSCRTISGRPTPDRATKKGAYFIKEHNEHRVLVGDNYRTPVNNWVRITWTGTGFHSASWQKWSQWTKDYYKTHGSHGCLNLSPEDAKTIYKLTKYREAVFIY